MNSLWLTENKNDNKFDNLSANIETDVCIIGAGIFGMTCGYYLSKAGLKVSIIEKDEIGHKTTGHTTAKITSQHGLFYTYLVETYGEGFAKDYLSANQEAIENIKEIIDAEKINCDFERQSNFVYTTNSSDVQKFKKEVDVLNSLGFPANFVTKTGLPFDVAGAVQFKNQAQFNPIKYLHGLAKSIIKNNGMYITSSMPTYSFRTANYNGRKILLLGGCGHKTGTPSSYKDTYGVLENYAKQLYPNCEILFRWDTRDCITLDKIPYIGRFSNVMDNIFVGTGFNKWGMTSSNVAANIVCDMILGKENEYAYVFDSTRVHPIKNRTEVKNMITESVNSLALKKLKDSNIDFNEIPINSGGIIDVNNQKVGIYKDTSR